MPKKEQELFIERWEQGISLNATTGFADMRNVKVNRITGMLEISKAAAKKSASVISGLPTFFVRDTNSSGTLYTTTSVNGGIYSNATPYSTGWAAVGSAPSVLFGYGIAIFKDYLFVAGDTTLYVYGPLSSSPAWYSSGASWKTLNTAGPNTSGTGGTHMMLWGQDDILYICNGRYIASVQQNAGQTFDPATSGSFTWNDKALSLPSFYYTRSLAELGKNLMIGTVVTNASEVFQYADVFPWDRTSATFDLPLRLFEAGINQLLNVNNQLYIQAGSTGRLYVYNGYQATVFTEVPRNSQLASGAASYEFQNTKSYPGAIIYKNGKIYFGMSLGTGASSGATGVYSIKLDGSGLVLENTISNGNSYSNISIGCLYNLRDLNDAYALGWLDSQASTQGIDVVGQDDFVTGYSAYAETPRFVTGTILSPNSFQTIEIYLAHPLKVNEGVKVQLRDTSNDTPTYTDLAIFEYATYGAKQAKDFPTGTNLAGFEAQFRIVLTGTTTTPRVKYVYVH